MRISGYSRASPIALHVGVGYRPILAVSKERMEMENRGCDSASDSECFVKPAHPMPMRPPSLYISSFTLVHSAYHSMFRVRSCATLTAPARPHVRHMCMCARRMCQHMCTYVACVVHCYSFHVLGCSGTVASRTGRQADRQRRERKGDR